MGRVLLKKIAFFALLILACLRPQTSWAKSGKVWDQSSIYQGTVNVCHKINADSVMNAGIALDRYRTGQFPSELFRQLIQDISGEGFDQVFSNVKISLADRVLESPGFQQALRHCYPFDPTKWKTFFVNPSIRQISKERLPYG